ncbi:MAG: hypothetical protein NTW19_15390 [Planctomycetota bacterium]|nr:hypothetical protein [Planctomycetota bacterium]
MTTLSTEQMLAVMTELCGGKEILDMLTSHYALDPRDRMTVRELAATRDLPKSVVQDQLAKARARLRRCALLPPHWKRKPRRRRSAARA